MSIHRRPGHQIAASALTDEAAVMNRRALLAAMGLGGALAAGLAVGPARGQGRDPLAWWEAQANNDPTKGLYPAANNPAFTLDRPVTEAKEAITYNNYYEFGSQKSIWQAAQRLETRPWTIRIEGMVATPRTVDIDTLIKAFPLQERTYRFRCVEAWSMAVPWTGFPMADLIRFAEPLGSARYVVFQTFQDDKIGPGFKQSWYPWPYTDGLTIEEATNDLAFMATGIYGKPLPPQMGAPIRFVTPWKYGFKQTKSIVKMTFTDRRPVGYWEKLQASEYGFWANVNPEVSHPRWSQASERVLGSGERRPTLLFNGYAEQVAGLYSTLKSERLYA